MGWLPPGSLASRNERNEHSECSEVEGFPCFWRLHFIHVDRFSEQALQCIAKLLEILERNSSRGLVLLQQRNEASGDRQIRVHDKIVAVDGVHAPAAWWHINGYSDRECPFRCVRLQWGRQSGASVDP